MKRFLAIIFLSCLSLNCIFVMRTQEKSTRFVNNPKLETIINGYPGNRMIDGIFVNGSTKDSPPLWSVIKWKLSKNPQGNNKKNEKYKPDFVENENMVQWADNRIVWLGHATFFIKISGVSLITDPCFNDLPTAKRCVPLPCSPNSIRGLHYILISHGHRDHCDMESIRILVKNNPGCQILGPLGLRALLNDLGSINIQEAGWYQAFDTPTSTNIAFLPAVHWNRRGLFDFNRMLWGGFLIRSGDHSLIFAGDTAYSEHFQQIRNVIGPVSVCLAPIGAYKPEFLMKSEHMNPEEAVRAANDLGAEILIPMHYGTYDLSDEPLGEPVKRLKKASGLFKGKIRVPAVGEDCFYDDL